MSAWHVGGRHGSVIVSSIQTCLCVVVGPGFVSISSALMRSSASHTPSSAGLPKNGESGHHCWGREVST